MPTGLHNHHAFLRYSKRTKVHLKILIADRPTPVTRREKPRSTSTSASQPHVLARSSPPPLILLQAPIVATIQVDIDDRRTRNVYCGGRAALSPSAVATRALVLLPAPPPRVARCPPVHEHLAARSARRCGTQLGLQKRKNNMRRSMDTGECVSTSMYNSSARRTDGRRSAYQHKHKRKKRNRRRLRTQEVGFAKILR